MQNYKMPNMKWKNVKVLGHGLLIRSKMNQPKGNLEILSMYWQDKWWKTWKSSSPQEMKWKHRVVNADYK